MEDLSGYEDRRFWDVPPKLERSDLEVYHVLKQHINFGDFYMQIADMERERFFGSNKLKKDNDEK